MPTPRVKPKPRAKEEPAELKIQQVRAKLYKHMDIPDNIPIIKKCIKDVGASRLTEVDPEDYAKLLKLVEGRVMR